MIHVVYTIRNRCKLTIQTRKLLFLFSVPNLFTVLVFCLLYREFLGVLAALPDGAHLDDDRAEHQPRRGVHAVHPRVRRHVRGPPQRPHQPRRPHVEQPGPQARDPPRALHALRLGWQQRGRRVGCGLGLADNADASHKQLPALLNALKHVPNDQ